MGCQIKIPIMNVFRKEEEAPNSKDSPVPGLGVQGYRVCGQSSLIGVERPSCTLGRGVKEIENPLTYDAKAGDMIQDDTHPPILLVYFHVSCFGPPGEKASTLP